MSLARAAQLRNAAALLGLLAYSASARAGDRPEPSGTVVVRNATVSAMEAGPLWVSRATWDQAEERIVIADPGSARIYIYDSSGRIERRVARPGQGPLEFTTPNYAFRIGERYLIAASPYRWIWFDKDLVPQSAWALDWEDNEGTYGRLNPYDFALSTTHLYAFAAARSHNGDWSARALYAVSLKDRSVQRVGSVAKDDKEHSFYLDPPFNLAVCDGKAWLLQMTSTVSIVEARDGGKRLRSFPSEFQKRPDLPPVATADDLAARRIAQRNAAVPEGLFCIDDRTLLLLAHRPRSDGGVQWLVYPIDPSRDVLNSPVELPTKAGEIVFVPGQKRWALLEKGTMKYPSVQPLTRIVSFPRPALSADKARTAP